MYPENRLRDIQSNLLDLFHALLLVQQLQHKLQLRGRAVHSNTSGYRRRHLRAVVPLQAEVVMARYHRVRYLPDKGGEFGIALILDTADPSPGAGLQISPEAEHHGDRHLAWAAGDRRCLFFHSADRAVIDIPAQIEYDDDLVGLRRASAVLGYETDG